MSNVYFASAKMKELRAESSLPAKFHRMLEKMPLKDMFDGKTVAVKMHLGFHYGYTTIPPLFVRMLVKFIKDAGGNPFITDGVNAIATAKHRGYTEETLDAPIVSAAGFTGKYYIEIPVNYLSLKNAEVCGEIVNADAMVVYSHGKGHGYCGWGGAIKNIAMGNVTFKTRAEIHALIDTEFKWYEDRCTHCYLCRDNCPNNAVSFTEDGRLVISTHDCKYCMHCVTACPQSAIEINEAGMRQFQTGMALVTKACLDTFEPNRVLFINHITDVTPFCDCWGFSSPSIVPDVGIVAGDDIVAVEKASIDMIKTEDFIEGSLPPPFKVRDVPGHLLQKIHAKDPYLQVEEAENAGLGESRYEIIEVE